MPLYAQTRLDTPMGPGFFIFFNELWDEGERGGTTPQFEVMPRRVYLKKTPGEPLLRWADILGEEKAMTEVQVTEGEKVYKVVDGEAPTPEQAIQLMPKSRLKEKVLEVEREYGLAKGEAMDFIHKVVSEELAKAEKIREELARNEDLAIFLIMSEA